MESSGYKSWQKTLFDCDVTLLGRCKIRPTCNLIFVDVCLVQFQL